MKFGEIFNSKIIAEWRTRYFQYEVCCLPVNRNKALDNFFKQYGKELLQEYKTSRGDIKEFEQRFLEFINQELDKINTFFSKKLDEGKTKLKDLSTKLDEFLEQRQKLEEQERSQATNSSTQGYGTFRENLKQRFSAADLGDFEFAFSEFYLSLIFLQNFQQLNLTAFRKILKKHDKVVKCKQGSKWHEELVLQSNLATCKDVEKMLADVEDQVTMKLEGGDRKKAMNRLRVPPLGQPHHSSWTVFRIGLWAGLLAALIAIIIALVPWSLCDPTEPGCWQDSCLHSNVTDELADDEPKFWEITLRLYRGIILFGLMVILLGINIKGWSASGVNHVLIFELDPRDHLSALHLIEIGVGLIALCCVSLVAWLMQFYIAFAFNVSTTPIRYSAFAFLVLIILVLVNPIPVMMYSSRKWIIKVVFRIIAAPFFDVRFADFWLADQFTSLVPVFQDFVFLICSCAMQFMPSQIGIVCDQRLFWLSSAVGCLPAWFRFQQCLRRWWDSGQKHPHLTNAGKYSTTIFVILFRSLHQAWDDNTIKQKVETTTAAPIFNMTTTAGNWTPIGNITTTMEPPIFNSTNPFIYCWIVAGLISTTYTYLWDIRMDWGLVDSNAGENRFLREQLIFSRKWYYYSAMGLDLVLRCTWTLTVAELPISDQQYITDIFITSLTFVEMFRRFVWNFFRLENEQLNNDSAFRAVRDFTVKTPAQEPTTSEEAELISRSVSKSMSTRIRNWWNRHFGSLSLLPEPKPSPDRRVSAVFYESYHQRPSVRYSNSRRMSRAGDKVNIMESTFNNSDSN